MLKKIQKAGLLISVALIASACMKKSKTPDLSYSEEGTENKLMNHFIQEVGNKVHFGFNKSELSSEAQAHLDRQAEFVKAHGKLQLIIEGYCDERGTEEYNIALGERRADAVKCYLSKKGIDPQQIEIVSYGKEKPEVEEHNEAAWAKNRRALTILK